MKHSVSQFKRSKLQRLIAAFRGPAPESVDPKRGRLLLESLESRQLLAGDVDLLATDGSPQPSPQPAAESSLVLTTQAEGEPANDLVQFAKDLDSAGVRFYGANWCPACTQQKELFEDGGDDLPFIEVTGPDRQLNATGQSEGITTFPTWEFPDSSRATGVLSLETISARSGVQIPQSENPTFAAVGAQTVSNGSPLHIPIDAYDPNGGPLTVTVQVDDPSLLEATVITGNRSLRLDMEGFGDMVFELFEQRAPEPAGRVATLAQSDFYDDIIFHRVVDNFVIQAGDPTGTGTSGSNLGSFDDQFHPDLQHNRSGVLSFAKTSDDTNNSQFFVTEVPTRHLDFNHSIFGQLVEGEDVREAISGMETNANGTPTTPIRIDDATVFTDTENSVIMLRGLGGTGQTSVTVTVTDGDNNTFSEVIQVDVVADQANSQPYLDPITTPAPVARNTNATLQLGSTDIENDTVIYGAALQGSQSNANVSVDSSSGLVTVTPANDFTGDVDVLVSVRSTVNNGDSDNQLVTFRFEGEAATTPTSLDLLAGSDTGVSNVDNVTSATTLSFAVDGVTDGATVQIVNTANDSVIGSIVASGTTATITTSNLDSLRTLYFSIFLSLRIYISAQWVHLNVTPLSLLTLL
ncbi:MAG: peptidylprolyl isomerase, partial [Planctomycetota bacterium]